ncbi:MAG: ABC transporter permease [Alphaproteobacteria bacterium]|nr:ABC transporter permease [Alphaproteobacteria bacterium]
MTSASPTTTAPKAPTTMMGALLVLARRNPTIVVGGSLLASMVFLAVFAPWIVGDPLAMAPANRLRPPSADHLFGTDHLGRDMLARTVFGARVSMIVGVSVAILSISIGLWIGLAAGYYRRVDAIVMRFMDGLMAIPGILLAIALVALTKASVWVVVVAITIPEIPRVVRLVRSVVLSVREQPYVDAAVAGGSRASKIIVRHILPATINPLIVQATYISASAILVEAGLSFLGAGVPPEIPTWGNMIAAARGRLGVAPWTIFFPGLCLALVVLAVNLLGDGLRDRLDPRIARRM